MRPRSDPHLPGDVLRELLDGELAWTGRLRCLQHLHGCSGCARALEELRRSDAETGRILAGGERPVDVTEGWARLSAVSGRRLAGRRSLLSARTTWVALVALAAALVLALRERGATDAHAATLHDRCCWDLDGGGPGDDGIAAVTLPGQRVVGLTLYEDTNGSRSLSASDRVRFGILEAMLATVRAAGGRAAPGASTIVRDFCCHDYDGGGPADDGVLTVNRPGEVVDHVVLYEDLDGDRRFSRADIVTWVGGLSPGVAPGEPPPR
ncbi:MAG: hypothetical protein ABR599_12495 [Gemmatimonadota bacterium]